MNTLSKVLFGIWILLAIADFVLGFTELTLLTFIVSTCFGILNTAIILSLASSVIQAKREAKKMQK